jgi:hypothetical protein
MDAPRTISPLERLVASRLARWMAAVLGFVVLAASASLVEVSRRPPTVPAQALAPCLPERPLDIPILRALPEPQPRRLASPVEPGQRTSPPSVARAPKAATHRRHSVRPAPAAQVAVSRWVR